MKKPDLRTIFYELQNQMISQLAANRSILTHPTTKGDSFEINWIKWLKVYLPKRYQVDRAFLIDSQNNISDQIDVVIYDQQYTPFVFNQDGAVYIPAESVYAIFEVKPELNKQYIEYAGQKTKSARQLIRTSAPIHHAGGILPPKAHSKIISGILCLESSWNPPLGDSFENVIKSLDVEEQLDIGCALKSGSFRTVYGEELQIEKSSQQETLIFFFLKLLIDLQKLGTIPALDISEYAKALDSI
ncbi:MULTISPECIES: DUF6602 domain-containing protein [unclassified Paenibacillus]|uniref:DUF6602 domain-containing protein n=1 Tax=unclassified Paenibacillus TaxID=185978 RepID=UPI001AE3821D|nr:MULTISPECIES: DUF6602 domain-containing protein [unclassified Paenibacillus]MBP1154642.1 putative membrane protein [Paenibacillus sp. PvP091]MBP1169974.1 putative membrane protein [Paenibacillus sp. PvR098]MBP2441002.1 putative membrane protein [Paenibacillus sp. PvP052]